MISIRVNGKGVNRLFKDAKAYLEYLYSADCCKDYVPNVQHSVTPISTFVTELAITTIPVACTTGTYYKIEIRRRCANDDEPNSLIYTGTLVHATAVPTPALPAGFSVALVGGKPRITNTFGNYMLKSTIVSGTGCAVTGNTLTTYLGTVQNKLYNLTMPDSGFPSTTMGYTNLANQANLMLAVNRPKVLANITGGSVANASCSGSPVILANASAARISLEYIRITDVCGFTQNLFNGIMPYFDNYVDMANWFEANQTTYSRNSGYKLGYVNAWHQNSNRFVTMLMMLSADSNQCTISFNYKRQHDPCGTQETDLTITGQYCTLVDLNPTSITATPAAVYKNVDQVAALTLADVVFPS